MNYNIKPYTQKQAKKIGVVIKPSKNPDKKLDVYRDNDFIASIGAKGMSDFPSYIQSHGLEYANERRKLYKKRHQKDRLKRWTPSWLSDNLLW